MDGKYCDYEQKRLNVRLGLALTGCTAPGLSISWLWITMLIGWQEGTNHPERVTAAMAIYTQKISINFAKTIG